MAMVMVMVVGGDGGDVGEWMGPKTERINVDSYKLQRLLVTGGAESATPSAWTATASPRTKSWPRRTTETRIPAQFSEFARIPGRSPPCQKEEDREGVLSFGFPD